MLICSIYFGFKYNQQSNYIRTEGTLLEIKYSKPASPISDGSSGEGWYGKYISNCQGEQLVLTTYPVSSKSFVKEKEVFYINPNDYKDYHLEYSKYSALRGLGGLAFVFIGTIGICLNNEEI